MPLSGTMVKGKYLDSVKLMLISKKLRQEQGVQDAVAIMATKENKEILAATEMLFQEFIAAPETDICIAIKAETEELCVSYLNLAKDWIEHDLPGAEKASTSESRPRSIDSAVEAMPQANLAIISVAGKYAGREAAKALNKGLNVLLFSDNVALETEKELKEKALSLGLLMMGPDCGSAIINGIPLAFANAVRRGAIGVVSASGTGLQEVTSVIHNLGEGVSQALGTGGRDGKKEIGGIMLLACLRSLMDDPETKVIVLISKVPDAEVISKLWRAVEQTTKPVVVNFLKPYTEAVPANVLLTQTLAETAQKACTRLKQICSSSDDTSAIVQSELFPNRKLVTLPQRDSRKYLRGLFSGGTLCYEAQNIYHSRLERYASSNAPLDSAFMLEDVWNSSGDTIIDLGTDDFTVGRPHPMIDYSLRLKKMQEESLDESVAVILLDVVLGYGAHLKPHQELAPVIRKIKLDTCIVVICSIIGTDDDPQNRQEVIETLLEAGAEVTTTNAEACELACMVLKQNWRRLGLA